MGKTIKVLKKIINGEIYKFKGYTIAELPKGFDKQRTRWFNQNSLTYIEKN